MPVKEGRISGSIATVAFGLPCKIISFFLTNRTSGSVMINVYIVTGTGDRAIVPLNLIQLSGTIYTSSVPIIMLKGYYLIITTNGLVDYFFSFE